MRQMTNAACDLLTQGRTFILATIVRHQGATPRTAGSKMLITPEGQGVGTIGGGLLEAQVMARAVRLIEQGQSALLHFDLSSEVITTMDMICGGRADVLLACIPPTDANRSLFGQWQEGLDNNQPGGLVTVARQITGDIYRTTHAVITQEGQIIGSFPEKSTMRANVLAAARRATRIVTMDFDESLVVLDPSPRITSAYLFGAGHVAQPTAHLAALVGFQVWVLDDRQTYANPERFPEAHRVRVIGSFEHAFADLDIMPDSYVVIFTRGHLHDKIVLSQALSTPAGYIGMIGSRPKRDAIFKALRAEGIAPSQIERVHSPIGLAIGAETPQEIAVSIVAQMIERRSPKT